MKRESREIRELSRSCKFQQKFSIFATVYSREGGRTGTSQKTCQKVVITIAFEDKSSNRNTQVL